MAATSMEDAWMETCFISISKASGSEMAFHGLTETVDFDIGDKDIEGVALLNGGRVTKWSPQADSTITFEAYPIEAGTDSGAVGKGFFDLMNAVDAVVPQRIPTSRTRNKYRVLVMWTNDATVTGAQNITVANASALRIGMADGYFTSVKPSFTDGILKFTCIFKCTPFDKSGNACVIMESCAGTSGTDILPVIGAYTAGASNKFA